MGETGRPYGAITRNEVLSVVGFGCLLSTYSAGPFSGVYLGSFVGMLAGQCAFSAGTAVGCLAFWLMHRRYGIGLHPVPGAVAYAAVSLLIVVAEVAVARPSLAVWQVALFSAMMGVAASHPLLFWCDALLRTCSVEGRMRFFVLLVFAELVALCTYYVGILVSIAGDWAGIALFAICIVTATACQLVVAVSTGCEGARNVVGRRSYRLTSFSKSLLACLGVTWGVACVAITSRGMANVPGWALAFAGLASCGVTAVLIRLVATGAIKFGGLVRISVALIGGLLAFMPVVQEVKPELLPAICQVVFICAEVALFTFSIDVCYEGGLDIVDILPLNYGFYVLTGCLVSLLFCVFMADGDSPMIWKLAGAVSALAVACVIPFLPGRSSDAVTFTLDELPEDAGYDAYIARRREDLIARCGISEREVEVLDLLLQGKTRKQIADELVVSPWTVKDRIDGIYKKTGAHSYKELASLISGSEQ